MKRAIHVMAKPTGFQCNLKCDYCFYLEKEKTLPITAISNSKAMNDTVLQQFIQQYIALNPTNDVDFTWQGGEPTLAGLDFYKKVVQYQKRYANGKRTYNSMQTNGVLLDEAWVEFLAENQFLMGISLDGTQVLHDHYRKNNAGKSVFNQVINAITLFKQYQIDFNVLTTLNKHNVNSPLDIYQFITQELSAKYLQFIPIVEQKLVHSEYGELIYPTSNGEKKIMPWSISGEEYGLFMTTLFDYWVRHDVGHTFVQLFDNALAAWCGDMPSLCIMQPTCGQGLVLEKNGDIYSCDHFVYPDFQLGNIMTDSLKKMATSKKQRHFGQQKSQLSHLCQSCDYKFACHGGCPKHRINKIDNVYHNHFCQGYKHIFSHIDPYMKVMAELLARKYPPTLIMQYADQIAANANNPIT